MMKRMDIQTFESGVAKFLTNSNLPVKYFGLVLRYHQPKLGKTTLTWQYNNVEDLATKGPVEGQNIDMLGEQLWSLVEKLGLQLTEVGINIFLQSDHFDSLAASYGPIDNNIVLRKVHDKGNGITLYLQVTRLNKQINV